MASSKLWESKDTSFYLWVALWVVTLVHAGSTAWAMFTTAQLPPGYEIPSAWVALNLGPSSNSYWLYVIVLGVNLVWESRFKGSKTYRPSTFPFPQFLYSKIALILWLVLWAFAHWGHSNGWFKVPDQVGSTLVTCFFLWLTQDGYIDQKSKETGKEEPLPAKAINHPIQAASAQTGSAVAQPKTVSKRMDSDNNELAQKLLDYVRQNGQAKTGALMGVLGSPRRTVIRNLNKLLEEGRLVREGSGPGAVYRLSDSPKAE